MKKYTKESLVLATIISLVFGTGLALIMHHKVEVYSDDYISQTEEFDNKKRTVLCMSITPECGWIPYESKKGFPFQSGSVSLPPDSYQASEIILVSGFLYNIIFYVLILFLPVLIVYDFLQKRNILQHLRIFILLLFLAGLIVYVIRNILL